MWLRRASVTLPESCAVTSRSRRFARSAAQKAAEHQVQPTALARRFSNLDFAAAPSRSWYPVLRAADVHRWAALSLSL